MENIKIKDIKINYECVGSGKDIILLHGWGQSIKAFRPTIDVLSQTMRVWTIDLPGFGGSDEPHQGLSIYDYEKILEEFIAVKKIKNPTLVGHSFGGRISIIYAANHDNIDKLVLTGAAGIKPKRTFGYKIKVAHYKFMKFLCRTPFYSQFKTDLLSTSGSADYKNASPVMKETLIKVVNDDLTYLLEEIEVPTLLYWGENDDATPIKDGQLMDTLIKDSELVCVSGFGHYAYLENNVDFNSRLLAFLA